MLSGVQATTVDDADERNQNYGWSSCLDALRDPSFLSSILYSIMAEVIMAESSSAPLTRRQHLANTFEAYRAGLDADVSPFHSAVI
jgi:hypothetical protein